MFLSRPWRSYSAQRVHSLRFGVEHSRHGIALVTAPCRAFSVLMREHYVLHLETILRMIKLLRLLSEESLEEVATAIGSGKARISTIENHGARHVGPNLQRRLEEHFDDVPFEKLVSHAPARDLRRALITKLSTAKSANSRT